MAYSGSLAPCFVNNDCVMAEIIYSTAHALHEVLTWSQVVCGTQTCELHLESIYCCLMAVSVGLATRGENIERLQLRPLHQSVENKHVCSSYSFSSFLPAFPLAPYLPWVQRTVWIARQLASRTGWRTIWCSILRCPWLRQDPQSNIISVPGHSDL